MDADKVMNVRERAFRDFCAEVEKVLLGPGAKEYGNSAEELYRTLGRGAPAQAIAEKAIRYGRTGRRQDLVKAAAYSFLGWLVEENHQSEPAKSAVRIQDCQ